MASRNIAAEDSNAGRCTRIDVEQQQPRRSSSNNSSMAHRTSTGITSTSATSGNSSSSSCTYSPDFSFCILWSPLPFITWMIPFIGHLGIADSRGYSHDFQGPYSIGKSREAVMAFGPTTRYLKMEIGQLSSAERWDEAIREADRIYSGRMHSESNSLL